MKRYLTVALFVMTTTVSIAQVADAKVLKEGEPTNGYYWQLIEKKTGSTQWLCRSIQSNLIQTHSTCQKAGARKP